MFHYEYPRFEKKYLLRIEMLEQLRDYPRNYINLLFRGYGNGIVNGCELKWEENELTVLPGMIYWGRNLYFMEEPYKLECKAQDNLCYLKVKFLEEIKESVKVLGMASIYIDNKRPNYACEMEIGRFRLQAGARLRSSYKNFSDFSTEYDTINRIHTPFSDNGGSTISPGILIQFAHEMLEKDLSDTYDVSFCMNVLANDGKIASKCIKTYLKRQCDSDVRKEDSNEKIYEGLLNTLKSRSGTGNYQKGNDQRKKGIVLL